jgi:hypothetical protein
MTVEVRTNDQIDVVARLLPTCAVSMVSSFTGGEFWESVPDRVVEGVFIDDTQLALIMYLGRHVVAPCADPIDIKPVSLGAVAQCSDGAYAYDVGLDDWRELGEGPVIALGADSESNVVVAAIEGADGCDGVEIRRIDLAVISQEAARGTCITPDVALPDTSLAIDGTTALLWSDAGVLISSNAGIDWLAAG